MAGDEDRDEARASAQQDLRPAQKLAVVADLAVHELGEWGETRWKDFVDEKVGVSLHLNTTAPVAVSYLTVGWRETGEGEEAVVLEWHDGVVDEYDRVLGPKVYDYLRAKLIPGTPALRMLDA